MIRKGIDVELNVKPVFLALYHKASYEGPAVSAQATRSRSALTST